MELKYYKLLIRETGRVSTKEEQTLFNTITEHFQYISDIKKYLQERYGELPKGRNKIFRDTNDNKSQIIGFTHTFWNKDISHDSKSWLQTDWITITNVIEDPINIFTTEEEPYVGEHI